LGLTAAADAVIMQAASCYHDAGAHRTGSGAHTLHLVLQGQLVEVTW
jgi:hypothetical protein